VAREKNFDVGPNELFDIAHPNAMQLIKIEEDRACLLHQHSDKEFVSSWSNVDETRGGSSPKILGGIAPQLLHH